MPDLPYQTSREIVFGEIPSYAVRVPLSDIKGVSVLNLRSAIVPQLIRWTSPSRWGKLPEKATAAKLEARGNVKNIPVNSGRAVLGDTSVKR